MRVLLTRPARGADRTASALSRRGHRPLLLPLTVARPLTVAWPDHLPAALVATSAEALLSLAGQRVDPRLLTRPIHCVGAATAAAARAAGFTTVLTGPGDAPGLAAEIARTCSGGTDGPLLYLAGTPRLPALEAGLAAAGIALEVADLYRMEPVVHADLAGTVAALRPDALTFFSREAVRLFFAALGPPYAAPLPVLCLSPRIAEAVPEGAGPIHVAARPEEAALLDLLDAIAAH